MSPRSSLVVALAVLVAGACAPVAEQAQSNRPARQAMLVVQNDNWAEVVVYILGSSSRVRLGTVASMRKGEFAIPEAYVLGVSNVTLQADPIGSSETYVSPPIQVFPGARLALRVQNQLRLSDFAVYATQ